MIWKLDELEAILGVPRREIIDADKRSRNGLLSWTKTHGGYACHDALLPDLRRALQK
jgi:hypothetical protein